MAVSSPGHSRYGQHLKRHELRDLVKPRAESTATVMEWLAMSGVEERDVHNDGEWISFHAPVKRAEEMMSTSFKIYQSTARPDVKRIRSLSYSVPRAVVGHIDTIQPTVRFGHIRAERSNVFIQEEVQFSVAALNTTQCNAAVTPACLADLYNYASYKVDPKASVTIGVNGFLKQYARYADYDLFVAKFSPSAVGSNFSFTSVNGEFEVQASQVKC